MAAVNWSEMVPASNVRSLEQQVDDLNKLTERLLRQPPRWLRMGEKRPIEDEPLSEYVTRWWVFPPGWQREAMEDELARWGYETQPRACRHDYDCCGNWYTNGLMVRRDSPVGVLVYCRWHRNI